MDVNADLIRKVAQNACLELSDAEVATFEKDFKEILGYFETLAKANVAEKPSFHPVDVRNNFKEDVAEESLSHKEAMQNVEEEQDGYIKGPKVI